MVSFLRRWLSPKQWRYRVTRYPLIFGFGIVFIALAVMLIYAMYRVSSLAHAKSQGAVQKELISGLSLVTSFLESPDGEILLSNVGILASRERALGPVVAGLSSFRSLPNRFDSPPPGPPRSCFVEVAGPRETLNEHAEICAYVSSDRRVGTWLNLDTLLPSYAPRVHVLGDPLTSADVWELSLVRGKSSVVYLVVLQQPSTPLAKVQSGAASKHRLFNLSAYDASDGRANAVVNRGHFEGWAYERAATDDEPSVLRLMARIDVKPLYPSADFKDAKVAWPPADIRTLTVGLRRVSADSMLSTTAAAQRKALYGVSAWSFPRLYDKVGAKEQYFLELQKRDVSGSRVVWAYPPLPSREASPDFVTRIFARFIEEQALTGTNTKNFGGGQYTVSMRALRSDWEVLTTAWSWLALILTVVIFAAVALIAFVFTPMFRLARQATLLAEHRLGSEATLDTRHAKGEVRHTAIAFNSLLAVTRQQAHDALRARSRHLEEEQRRRADAMRAREANLRTIGHEIRSPLQALLGLHKEKTDASRRYIDRMIAAIRVLYGVASPEAAFAGAELVLERYDIARYLSLIAENAPRAGIENVRYNGPGADIVSEIDLAAFEDSVGHILSNAHRFRRPNTAIVLDLAVREGMAHISISNAGEQIPRDMLEKIFEYGTSFSTAVSGSTNNQGQGLFAARSYIHKMKGTLRAQNIDYGVMFEIELPVIDTTIDP